VTYRRGLGWLASALVTKLSATEPRPPMSPCSRCGHDSVRAATTGVCVACAIVVDGDYDLGRLQP
jgi:hypothetical protein